jgi:hypothetical protein
MYHHVPVSHVLPDQMTGAVDSGAVLWSKQAGPDVNAMRPNGIPEADVQIRGCPALRMVPLRRVEIVGRSRPTRLVCALAIVKCYPVDVQIYFESDFGRSLLEGCSSTC